MADLEVELPDWAILFIERDARRVQMDTEDFVREILVGVAALPDGVPVRTVRSAVMARRLALL